MLQPQDEFAEAVKKDPPVSLPWKQWFMNNRGMTDVESDKASAVAA